MIQSIVKGAYGDARTGFKYSFIFTKIVSFVSTPEGRVYRLENYLVDENQAMTLYGSTFEKSLTNDEIKNLDMYVESLGIPFVKVENGETILLTHNEKEWAKIPYGLLYFVKNDFLLDAEGNATDKTVFLLNPNDWELCEQ